MEIYILDKSFNKLKILDECQSILWVDRFNKPGEFELYLGADETLLQYLKIGYYLYQKTSEHLMMIETIKVETDAADEDHFIIKGRSIESLLGRRIVWKRTDINNTKVQTAVKRLMNENVINPEDSERAISGVIFQDNLDPKLDALKMDGQYTGDNLLDVITDICDTFKIGFKMILNDNNQFVFSLFVATDRSYDQDTETYVIFSPKFDNILSTSYYETDENYKNVTLVMGDGEDDDRKRYVVGTTSGLERRELYTDARDISSKDPEDYEQEIPIADYNKLLEQRGKEKLEETKKEKTFEAKLDPYQTFQYGRDFFIGDIVQVRNEFGIEGSARIVEYIMSESADNGLEHYPTFEAIQEDAEE